MSDYRGPPAGPGDEPPDAVPRTGPPGEPVAAPVPDPATPSAEPAAAPPVEQSIEPVAEAQAEPVAAPADASPIEPGVEPALEEVLEAAPTEGWGVATAAVQPEAPSLELLAPELLPRVMPVAARTADFAFGSAFAAIPARRLEQAAAAPAPQAEPPPLGPANSASIFTPPAPPLTAAPMVAASVAPASQPTLDVPAPPASTMAPPPRSVWPRRIRRAILILMGLVVGYAVLVLTLIVAYRWIDPPRSALMITTRLSGQPVLYAPVPITSISSYLQRAVITSEDARFCQHQGVDWGALYEAMNESRGGSTITMQTAKNLFLWSSRSYVRKAIEIPVALTIDAFWPKRRILEVYLNIAEWGPGIFGAEAASYYHFDKPASRLTAHEATLLAATLPNPIARDAGEPGRITSVLASRLRGRMANSDAFVRCLGLRSMPRAETPAPARPAAKAPAKQQPAAADQKSWKTTTEPAFNPWQN